MDIDHREEYGVGQFGTRVGIELFSCTLESINKEKTEFLKLVHMPIRTIRFSSEQSFLLGYFDTSIFHNTFTIARYEYCKDYVGRNGYYATFVSVRKGSSFKHDRILEYLGIENIKFREAYINNKNRIEFYSVGVTQRTLIMSSSTMDYASTILSGMLDHNSKLQIISDQSLNYIYDNFGGFEYGSQYRANRIYIANDRDMINFGRLPESDILFLSADVIDVDSPPGDICEESILGDFDESNKISGVESIAVKPKYFTNDGDLKESINYDKHDQQKKRAGTYRRYIVAFARLFRSEAVDWIVRILVFICMILLLLYLFNNYGGRFMTFNVGEDGVTQSEGFGVSRESLNYSFESIEDYIRENNFVERIHDDIIDDLDLLGSKGVSMEILSGYYDSMDKIKDNHESFASKVREVNSYLRDCEVCPHTKTMEYLGYLQSIEGFNINREYRLLVDNLIIGLRDNMDRHYSNGYSSEDYYMVRSDCSKNPSFEFLLKSKFVNYVRNCSGATKVSDIAREFVDSRNNLEEIMDRIIMYNPCDISKDRREVRGSKNINKKILVLIRR